MKILVRVNEGWLSRLTQTKYTSIRLVADIIEHFKNIVLGAGGGNYQTLINDALREHIQAQDKGLEKALRKVIREELKKAG